MWGRGRWGQAGRDGGLSPKAGCPLGAGCLYPGLPLRPGLAWLGDILTAPRAAGQPAAPGLGSGRGRGGAGLSRAGGIRDVDRTYPPVKPRVSRVSRAPRAPQCSKGSALAASTRPHSLGTSVPTGRRGDRQAANRTSDNYLILAGVPVRQDGLPPGPRERGSVVGRVSCPGGWGGLPLPSPPPLREERGWPGGATFGAAAPGPGFPWRLPPRAQPLLCAGRCLIVVGRRRSLWMRQRHSSALTL